MVPPIDYNIRVHEDNEGAIKMAGNRFSSRRSRHIEVKHHMVRDAVDGGMIHVEYVKSGEQHADVRTKAIDAKSFQSMSDSCRTFNRHSCLMFLCLWLIE